MSSTATAGSAAAPAASGEFLAVPSASGMGGGSGAVVASGSGSMGSPVASPLQRVDDFPIAISWRDVKCRFDERQILKGITGTALPGRLLCIAGCSGAGKTTLIKIIADRLRKEGSDRAISGELFVNEQPFTDEHRSLISFVPQDDILNGLSTAEESLDFAARMKRGDLPTEETDKMVHESLKELGLMKVKDTMIGIPGLISGLSGGERKRTNVGCEQVNQPKVLILDEPTTGLDTYTSERIVRLLRDLAHRGRTVICTIHQPTFEAMQMFDDYMLMADGRIVYHGPMDQAVSYFASVGFSCPTDSTPTDYFMWHIEDEKDRPKLLAAWADHLKQVTDRKAGVNGGDGAPLPDSLEVPYVKSGRSKEETLRHLDEFYRGSDVPLLVQTLELFKRAFRNAMRNQINIIATLLQSVLFGVFTGVLFNNLTNDTQGISDRFGILFTMAVNMGFSGGSAVINTFPAIKAVFLREQQAGAYSVGAFFVATFLADMPLQILAIFLQCVIVYFASQLVQDAARFFLFFIIMFVAQQVSVSIGLALSAGTSNPVIAAALIPALMTPMLLTGGLLVSTDRLHPYWYWLERISFIRMNFNLLAHNEFDHVGALSCDVAKYGARFCSTQPQNGTAAMEVYGLNGDMDQDWVSWVTLFAILIVLRLLGWFALVRAAGTKE